MSVSAAPTSEVVRARRYVARVRIMVALAGGALLLADQEGMEAHPLAAGLGLGVIGLTGVLQFVIRGEHWVRAEEAFACVAAILIVGVGGVEVTPIAVLWLVAAATGVLARGGRAGWLGRLIIVCTLFSPLVVRGTMSAENLAFAVASILLLLAVGRISRETADLLRQARFAAEHDALTGLLSRSAFRAQVDLLAARSSELEPAAMILIDFDDFGAVNKRRGHAVGDALLIAATKAMKIEMRDADAFGRVGGDEFAAFVSTHDPAPVAERLVAAIAEQTEQEGVHACAGVARCPVDGDDAEALLAAADVALRVAKRSGKKSVAHYVGAPLFSSTEDGARAALERLVRGEGLQMAVQPIVDLESGRPHAYEALARFATRGGEGPLHWFSLADELGMRAELELACLRIALDLLPDLPGESRLSVNLSAPMLLDPRAVAELLSRERLSRVIVEVTEETLVRHGAAVITAIDALKGRGVGFGVDDIGAGYSGLGQLAALGPSYLKLDRGLVRDIDQDPARTSLVRVLVDYAQSTGGLLVAEGVETQAELQEVWRAGAPLVQGFLLARPGPPWPPVATQELVPPGLPAASA